MTTEQPPFPPERPAPSVHGDYPLHLEVEYPDRELNRVTSAFRVFTVIPIAIVLATLGTVSASSSSGDDYTGFAATGGGLLFAPALLMILFRQKYPRWWFDWNRELLRFSNRVYAYAALLSDRYPSTDEQQYVALEVEYPDARNGLNRWLPLVKWWGNRVTAYAFILVTDRYPPFRLAP